MNIKIDLSTISDLTFMIRRAFSASIVEEEVCVPRRYGEELLIKDVNDKRFQRGGGQTTRGTL